MKIRMALVLAVGLFSFEAAQASATSLKFTMETDNNGKVGFFRMDAANKKVLVPVNMVTDSINSMVEKIKEVVCPLQYRPETVEASVGIASVAWEVDALCDKK